MSEREQTHEANELLRKLNREAFVNAIDIEQLPHAVGLVLDYRQAAIQAERESVARRLPSGVNAELVNVHSKMPTPSVAEESMSATSKPIPVISLWMPWANWVSLGWKSIETRTHKRFASLVGKRIGIHASLRWDNGAINAARPYLTQVQVLRAEKSLRIGGAIICTAIVSDFRPLTEEDEQDALIECRSVQRYGLVLTDIRQIEAIPCKGKQGIWYQEVTR